MHPTSYHPADDPDTDDPRLEQWLRTRESLRSRESERSGGVRPTDGDRTPEEELAADFLERYRSAKECVRQNVDALAAVATGGDDSQQARATSAIFGALVEPLSDAFDSDSIESYIRVMAQLIHYCRRRDPGLDSELATFGLASEQDLIARSELLRPGARPGALNNAGACRAPNPNRVKLVIILPRVTIGADVAITSVLLGRLKQKFPRAALMLAGGVKLKEIFGGDLRFSFAELEYGRRATLMGRLGAWIDLVSLIRDRI